MPAVVIIGAAILLPVIVLAANWQFQKWLLGRLEPLLDEQQGLKVVGFLRGRSSVSGHCQGRPTMMSYISGGKSAPTQFEISIECACKAPFTITRQRHLFSRQAEVRFQSPAAGFADGVLSRSDVRPAIDELLEGSLALEALTGNTATLNARWAVPSRRIYSPDQVRDNLARLCNLAVTLEHRAKAWLADHPTALSAVTVDPVGSPLKLTTTITIKKNNGEPLTLTANDVESAYAHLPEFAKKLISLADLEAKIQHAIPTEKTGKS